MTTIAELQIKVSTPGAAEANRELEKLSNTSSKVKPAVESTESAFEKLRGEIDPTAKALARLTQQQEQLKSAFMTSKGSIPEAEYIRLNSIIEGSRKRITDLGASTGKTAKEINFAMRGLPAQFTDIFVSLQGGQAPLTVFLQQGGQLKDMFGGIGPAARAMGGYILGLANPFTITAAAAGTLAVAWYQGSKEAENFNKALILTGNYIGLTAGQLGDMASRLDEIGGTRRNAAAVLTQIASTSKFTATQIEGIAEAAISMEKATGKAVEDTIKDFENLATKPAETSRKLGDQYGYLTAAVYSQILALEQQGKTIEAGELAMRAYEQGMANITKNIQENTGLIEKAWQGVTSAAGEAWDSMLAVGRETSIEDKLKDIREQLTRGASSLVPNALLAAGTAIIPGANAFTASNAAKDTLNYIKAQTEEGRKQLQLDEGKLVLQQKTQEMIAAAQGQRQQDEKLAKDAEESRAKAAEAALSNAEKLRRKFLEIDKERAAAAKVGLVWSDAEFNAYREQARKDIMGKGSSGITIDKTELTTLDGQIELIKTKYKGLYDSLSAQAKGGTVGAEAAYNQRRELLVKESQETQALYDQQIQALEKQKKTKGASAAQLAAIDQQIIKVQNQRLKNEQQLQNGLDVAAEQESARIQKQTRDLQDYIDTLNKQTDLIRRTKQQEADALGMGRRRASLEAELNQIRQKTIDQMRELNKLQAQGAFKDDPEGYQRRVEELQKAEADAVREVQEGERRKLEATQDWSKGAIRAWEDYRDSANDINGQTYDVFTKTFKGIEDYLVGFVTGTKASFKDLVKSIIADLARIQIKRFLGGLFGGDSSSGGGGGIMGFFGSLFGGGDNNNSGGGNIISGIFDLFKGAKNVTSMWDTFTGLGTDIMSGFARDGFTGAFKSGANYFTSSLQSTFQNIANVFGQQIGQTTAEVAGKGIAGAAAQQAGQTTLSATLSNTLSSLTGMLSNPYTWITAGVMASWKLYDAGVEADPGAIRDRFENGSSAARIVGKQREGETYAFQAIDKFREIENWMLHPLPSALIGGEKLAAISTGSPVFQAVSMMLGRLFGGGEKFKTTVGSAVGSFSGGEYTSKGISESWFPGTRTFGEGVDGALHDLNATFSKTLGGIFERFGIDEDIQTEARVRLRRTSGKLASDFFATIGDDVIKVGGQFAKGGNIQKGLTQFFDVVLGEGIAKAIGVSDLPQYVKNLTAGIKKAEEMSAALNNLFTKFDGVNNALELMGLTALKASDEGLNAMDSLLAMAGSIAGLEADATDVDRLGAFTSMVGTYMDLFLTEEEKFANSLNALKNQFTAFGAEVPTTREGFRAIVEGLDLTTQKGQETFSALMAMSPAMDSYLQALEKQREALLNAQLSVTGNIKDLQQQIILDQLGTSENRYNYFKQQADALSALLPTLTNVAAIEETTNKITSLYSSAYALLDEEGKKQQGGEFIGELDKLSELSVKAMEDASNKTTEANVKAIEAAFATATKSLEEGIKRGFIESATVTASSGQIISDAAKNFAYYLNTAVRGNQQMEVTL